MKLNKRQRILKLLGILFFAHSAALAKSPTVSELFAQANQSSNNSVKTGTVLPTTNLGFSQKKNDINLNIVKPPKTSEVMQRSVGDGNKAEYEHILNQQIQELFKLTQKFKASNSRGEMWLRLAELYIEKASLIDERNQDEYDAKLNAFQSGKLKSMPVLNAEEAREWNRKAVQLYEWFQRDFPNDEKSSQALFFLGYNYFELGEIEKAVGFYQELNRRFPDSPFSTDTHFALAEYFFENEKWSQAYKEYSFIIKDKKHRLNTFALYKAGWCLYRLGHISQSIKYLEHIIKMGRVDTGTKVAGQKAVNRTKLEGEAIRDIIIFYAEGGDPSQAPDYFKKLAGTSANKYLEKLAYQYSDRGNKNASKEVFRYLVSQDSTATKAFEYQYQIVQHLFYAKDNIHFNEELNKWIRDYGVNSPWYLKNKSKNDLIETSTKLRETTLRNFVLQQHQVAQSSKAPFSQAQALEGYKLYLKEFSDSAMSGEMYFYFGELLYDMEKYDEAITQYKWVLEHYPSNKYYEQAAQNIIVAMEKNTTPFFQDGVKNAGSVLTPTALDSKTEKFITLGKWYLEKFPRSEKNVEVKFKIGRIYYQANQFDEANKIFNQIALESNNAKYVEYSANLILDIYNLKKDYVGLELAAKELLKISVIAASKVGNDIRDILEKASFKKGQELETQGKYVESALAFSEFHQLYPNSNLAVTSLFNAGVNFERSGQFAKAIASYKGVLTSTSIEAEALKNKSRRLLAKLYQDSIQFEEAAKLYQQAAEENHSDPLANNMIYNAAILREVLGQFDLALKLYSDFLKSNKKNSENLDVAFSMAEIYRKMGKSQASILRYAEYFENGGQDSEKLIESAYWISKQYKKQGSIAKTKEWSQKAFLTHKRLAAGKKIAGSKLVADLKLEDAVENFKEMKSISFPRDPEKQRAAVNRKVNLLTTLANELAEVIKFDSAEEIVSALGILGEANINMVETIKAAPLPLGLNPEEKNQYLEGIEKFAEPFQQKAGESFKATVERGFELEVYNNWFHSALEYMTQKDPTYYYDGGEQSSEIRLINWMGH